MNESYNYPIQKPNNNYRIITLGDSFTFGQYVETKKNYAEVLENLLNTKIKCKGITQFEAINLGVPGYDIEYSVQRMKKRGIKYNPDLVIWLLNNWNFENLNELTLPLKEELLRKGEKDFDPIVKNYQAINDAISLIHKKYGQDFISRYQANVFSEFKDFYKGKLLLASASDLKKEYKNFIIDFVNQNSTNYYYFDGVFDTDINENYHLLDSHLNEKGHKKIAESIMQVLLKQFLIECNMRSN